MTTDEWRDYVARMAKDGAVVVPQLALNMLLDRLEAVETWATNNVEGDKLRGVLWPRRGVLTGTKPTTPKPGKR